MAATIKDIARQTGLDISTVSRGLRDDPRVKASTVTQIKAAANELGYTPNLSARNLVTGKTDTVWFLHTSYSNEVETRPVESAGKVLSEEGMDLLSILYRGDADVFVRQLLRLKQGLSDAAIIIPAIYLSPERETIFEILQALQKQNTPVIALDREIDGIELPIITSDNAQGSSHLVAEGVAFGCTNFVVDFSRNNSAGRCRYEVADRDIQAAGRPVLETDAFGHIVGQLRPGPVAILESTQSAIINIVEANPETLKDRDLFFGTFDNFYGNPWPARKVVVVEQDFETIGKLGAQLILNMLAGKRPEQRVTKVPIKAFRTIVATTPG